VIDTAVIDTAVIDTAVVIVDSAVPDTRPDSAVPDLPIVVSPDVRLDSPVADRASDLVPDAPAVGIPDAEADGGLGDALADVGGRDAVAKDTQVFPVVDSSPIDTTAPNPVPDAEIVVDTAVPDTAVPVPPVPDAAVGPGPQEPAFVLNNPRSWAPDSAPSIPCQTARQGYSPSSWWPPSGYWSPGAGDADREPQATGGGERTPFSGRALDGLTSRCVPLRRDGQTQRESALRPVSLFFTESLAVMEDNAILVTRFVSVASLLGDL